MAISSRTRKILELAEVSYNSGKDMLLDKGFLFEKDKVSSNGRSFWKCVEARRGKCPARRHTEGNKIIKSSQEHNHVPDIAAVEARKAVVEIKERAQTSSEAGYILIGETVSKLSEPVLAKLPNIESIKRTIRRQRSLQVNYPPNPNSIQELEIPKEMRNIRIDGEKQSFLLFDNGADNDERILIFSTYKNLDLLASCDHWYMGGSFKTSPPLFKRVYTIHGVQFNNCVPLIFVLLSGKTKETYQNMLCAIKTLKSDLQPTSITTDFERAAMDIFETEFSGVSITGCFFHLTQCLWRKVEELDKTVRYSNDAEFALQVKMLCALAYLPLEDVTEGFEELVDSEYYKTEEDIQPIGDYFEDVWIGRPRKHDRRPALFSHFLWNCYDTIEDNLQVNNSVETWHRGFARMLNANQINFWKFVHNIKKEQEKNKITICNYIEQREAPPSKKVYQDANIRIRSYVEQYHKNDKLLYLRGIANYLNLNV